MAYRIFYTSDLHTDQYVKFGESSRPLAESGVDLSSYDAIIIAGDLTTGGNVRTALPVLREIAQAEIRGIIVLGNHDYYSRNSDQSVAAWDDLLRSEGLSEAITLLHTEDTSGKRCGTFLNGILVVGGTLWTDAGREPEVAAMVDSQLPDATYIGHRIVIPGRVEASLGYRTKYSYLAHLQCKDLIAKRVHEERLAGYTGPVVLVTHHCPTRLCIHPDYLGPTDTSFKTMVSRGFFSDADAWLDTVNPRYVICGHTHRKLAIKREGNPLVQSGPRTILMNAFGYPRETRRKGERFSASVVLEV